ncbi:MAG: zinc ABC transporter substrate-binding protein [Lachnospiraceae bacterium]|nr:zinc ABC transporter substrate-binding protein [Lachnospiraceae bacterium]
MLVGCESLGQGLSASDRGTGKKSGGIKAQTMYTENREDSRESKKKVVVTLFPYYDFVRQIAGDNVELTLVIPAGMDSHSFEPTPADMRTIQNADILICNGGGMEHWLSQVLEATDTSHMRIVTMMDYVDVVEEELVEGMEVEDHEHHGETEYDEHIWTSPVNAMKLASVIGQLLEEQDPAHGQEYQERTRAFLEELERIDQSFRQICESRRRNVIVVGDKFPFRYLAEEYGIDYRAAFSGCSTDTEPSARTIAYLIDKVKEEKLPVIYFLETGSRRVSEIIGEETRAKPLLLHSCHTVTRRQFEEGVTYVELMEQNIENLKKGLNE